MVIDRKIILDTETTGMSHEDGHRLIEIGALEMIDRRLTGRSFHVYLNPDRPVDEDALSVHGISDEFLKSQPRFKDVAGNFIMFIKDSELIIHNAPFDVGFINSELARLPGYTQLEHYVDLVTDSLAIARRIYPGQRNNLDALCNRLKVDNSSRALHGALLDSEILADVYIGMTKHQLELDLARRRAQQVEQPAPEPEQTESLLVPQ